MQLRFFLFLSLIVLSSDMLGQESLGSRDRCIAPIVELKADEAKYPGAKLIKNTSNLRRKTGIALTATGDRISFTGKIVDSSCVPVPGVLIEIWQADMTGAYTFPVSGKKVSTDPNFGGTGRFYTDNEGNFSFLTIFPGTYADRAPHINYRITHPDFQESIGAVFFEYHPSNAKDPVLAQYKAQEQVPLIAQKMTPGSEERLTDRNYAVKIVLKGKSTFRRY